MIKEFIDQWWKYKDNMERYFKSISEINAIDYEDIVKALIDNVLNCGIEEEWYKISTDIHVIDDLEYHGTQIFVVHNDTYQPDVDDYFFTHNYYGSCSGCDTLLSIVTFCSEPATDEQVKELMKLAFDLLRNFKPLVEGAKYKGKSVHLTEWEELGDNS